VRALGSILLTLAIALAAQAAKDVVSAVHGTIQKVDLATKTIVVKTADGAEHSLRFLDRTAVHGVHASAGAGENSWRGLKKGMDVVAHYTRRGTEDTAIEVDNVGTDGLKSVEGTIKDLDRGGKKMVVESSDGVDSTFQLTDHAAQDAGKDIANGAEKGAKVTVYYSEDAGKRVDFFEKG
jgi:hypothetical protein